MRIRHLIAAADVDGQGTITAPEHARHGVVAAGRIAALSGEIDPLTHLNLDFAEHQLDDCLIAERLEVGAAMLRDDTGFAIAYTSPAAYRSLGPVDIGQRRAVWQQQFRKK